MNWFKKRSNKNKKSADGVLNERNKQEKKKNKKIKEINLDSIKYIPLPPSPKSWDIDGRSEFHKEYDIPEIKDVYNSSYQKKYTIVIKKSLKLSNEQLKLNVGMEIAKAYRHLIVTKFKSKQVNAAAKWSNEMFCRVGCHCNDTDKRRHNKILDELDKKNIKHSFKKIKIQKKEIKLFEILENNNWELLNVVKLSKEEKPDPAFKIMSFTADGTVYYDKNGNSEIVNENYRSALLKYDLYGNILAKKPVRHNVYKFSNNPKSLNKAIMDDDGVLYVYDKNLNLILQKELKKDKRINQHYKRYETNYWGTLKSQVRAIDVNSNSDKLIFTIADEIWCCLFNDKTIWGVRTPLNEGWDRVIGKSNADQISSDVQSALDELKLSLPVSPDNIKRQYRKMAQIYHPDINNNINADENMKKINEAFETLTGIDPETLQLDNEQSEKVFFRKTKPDYVMNVSGFSISISTNIGYAQDWIYEACFSSDSDNVYIGTYSGKIVELDNLGNPLRVFDIGTVPCQIIELGKYLYITSTTRLYIIKDKKELVGFVDIFNKGRLLVTKIGFGLLNDNEFKWYSKNGSYIGKINSKNPIRSIYSNGQTVIVETRMHRAIIKGFDFNLEDDR